MDATHESEQWRNLPNVEERFWAKVDKTEGCWLWKLSPSSRGYGFFHYTAVKNHHKIGKFIQVGQQKKNQFYITE